MRLTWVPGGRGSRKPKKKRFQRKALNFQLGETFHGEGTRNTWSEVESCKGQGWDEKAGDLGRDSLSTREEIVRPGSLITREKSRSLGGSDRGTWRHRLPYLARGEKKKRGNKRISGRKRSFKNGKKGKRVLRKKNGKNCRGLHFHGRKENKARVRVLWLKKTPWKKGAR